MLPFAAGTRRDNPLGRDQGVRRMEVRGFELLASMRERIGRWPWPAWRCQLGRWARLVQVNTSLLGSAGGAR
jgi:hypothetical protein